MDDLRGSIAQAAAEDRSVWSGTARVERLAELLEARERLEAETLRALGDVLADRAWESDGACSPVAWLADRGSMTAREAARLVSTARLAHEHDTVGKSLAAGDVTTSHVQLITRAARHRERVFAEHVDVLVDAARTVAPEPFVKVARTWRHLADDVVAGGASGDGDRWWLDTSVTFEGAVRVDGLLDPERGDAHHVVPWFEGGPTTLDNLALLCRSHHTRCHRDGWQLTRGPDGWTATPPERMRC